MQNYCSIDYTCILSSLLHKCSVSVFNLTMVFPFVISRHSWHRCIYISVTINFSVVACTITLFNKTYLLWTFYDHVILRYTSKEFLRRTFRLSIGWNINRASFILLLSYPFETLFCRVINTSTKCALCLKIMCPFTIPTNWLPKSW